MEAAQAAAAAAGPCVFEEIQTWGEWKAPAFFECTSGVLLWGQLPTVMQGFLEKELDTPLGPYYTNIDSHSTILRHSFRYRAPARKGLWKVEAAFGRKASRPLGYVCHHVDADGPDLLRRAALVGVSLANEHADRDIVYVNRYDWAQWGCPHAGYQLMTELQKPEKKPVDKVPKGTKPKPKGSKPKAKKKLSKDPEDDYDEYKEALIMNRFMLVDEQGFPQLVQSLRDGVKLDTKNYLFKDNKTAIADSPRASTGTPSSSSDAFGFNLGVGYHDNELGWLAFQNGELVGFVYDGVYCDLDLNSFRLGDTEVCKSIHVLRYRA